jgi:ActR/RegA family two-component response regulator
MDSDRHGTLVAVSPPSIGKLHALLEGCDADYFDSYGNALSALGEKRYETVVIGLHFGESRMFELVREVKRRQPGARVICIQGTAGHLNETAIDCARTALQQIGAEGVIDLSRLSAEDCACLAQLMRTAAAGVH